MYTRILVPIDSNAISTRALDEALVVAKLTGATVRLLHVLDELVFVSGFETGATYTNDVLPRLRQRGDRILAEARARVAAAGVPVDTLLFECFARRTAEVVLEQAEAWGADLIVLGTHGRRGMSRVMLGSDAEEVVRGASVPVLLVRPTAETIDEAAAESVASTKASPPPAARATV